MSTCWKCGKEVQEGATECEYGCGGEGQIDMSEFSQNYVAIDFTKVRTLDDLIELNAWLHSGAHVHRGHPHFEKIKRFTKERGT